MKSCTIDLRGGTIVYTYTIDTPTIVLLHAFPLDREMWQPQFAALKERTRLLAIDLPGFGQSPPGREPFTVDAAADMVACLLKELGRSERVTLCGLSMGGYVAMSFARRYPDRLAGLILADTRSEPDDDVAKQNRARLIELAKEKGAAGVVEQMLPKLLCDATRANQPGVVETVRTIALRQSVEGLVNGLAALRDRPDASPGLEQVTVPTLILVGEHDAATPPALAAAMAARVQKSSVVTIPNAGHLSNLENPEAFNAAIINFLPATKLAGAGHPACA